MNALQRDQALRQAVSSMSQTAVTQLANYHKACIEDAKQRLVSAPIESVSGYQAEAKVHIGILQALTAGA